MGKDYQRGRQGGLEGKSVAYIERKLCMNRVWIKL